MNSIPKLDHLCIVRLCQVSPRNFIPALGFKLLRVCLFVYMFINFVFTTLIENGVCIYLFWSLNLVEVTHTRKQGKSRSSFQYLSLINTRPPAPIACA